MKRGKILIIDDNEDILFALQLLLEPYIEKIEGSTDPELIESYIASFSPDIILLDMNFRYDAISGQEGFYWLDKIKNIDPSIVVIFITAYADMEKAIQAIKAGATDFIPKPWVKEKLIATILSAMELRSSRDEIKSLKQQVHLLGSNELSDLQIIGESEPMLEVFSLINKLSNTEANVLILGENGTGKDLIAQALHRKSRRSNKLFIDIDLGAIPEQLFESELFGYKKGAFTDAKTDKPGRIELASGGTLFLDEIGNLSSPMQAKLLTVIEKQQVQRLGATESKCIDVRLISATNSDIYSMVDQGLFRQDLLYRINTVEIHIPPLRERENDILLLAEHFLKLYTSKYKKSSKSFAKDAKLKLLKYNWPGNVRELQHAIERVVILNENKYLLSADDLILTTPKKNKNTMDDLNLNELEKKAIEKALHQVRGNISKAADLLGITRFALYRKMEKFEL